MRAFVAVEIVEESILGRIRDLQSEMARGWAADGGAGGGGRPVDADILHFTLQFLGEIPEQPQPVIDAVSAVRFAGFDLEIRGVGAFPNSRSPRIVWVGAGEPAGEDDGGRGADGATAAAPDDGLAGLAQSVSDALAPLGYLRDKPFVAHSTIFRIKRRGGGGRGRGGEADNKGGRRDLTVELDGLRGTVFGVQRVSSFKLKRSRLTPKGPVYTDLAEVGATE